MCHCQINNFASNLLIRVQLVLGHIFIVFLLLLVLACISSCFLHCHSLSHCCVRLGLDSTRSSLLGATEFLLLPTKLPNKHTHRGRQKFNSQFPSAPGLASSPIFFFQLIPGHSGQVVKAYDSGVNGPRFESHR